MSDFFTKIVAFNAAFGLPTPQTPQLTVTAEQKQALALRIGEFTNNILDEVDEGTDIIKALAKETAPIDIMTDLADWLGDLIVYAASEAYRHGIPLTGVLDRIIASQYSKFDVNGNPIYANGKIQKGPNYRPPEGAIAELLAAHVLMTGGAPK